MKRILIADDHNIVITGISVLVRAEYLNVQIDECSDGDSAWKQIQSTAYDLFIMDINMPGTDSVNLLKNVFSIQPKLKVLILSMSSEEIYAMKYLQLGAMGFINKDADALEIRKAIVNVMNNKKYLSPRLQESINRDAITGAPNNLFENLSARELEVMTHLIEGKNVSEIAEILSIHISTVSTHKANILQKLKVNNVIELTRIVNRFDLA
ncbi:response regulator transcription factor [Niastella caeni]|uniref:Response regulator transcription factor n=1 Tax=Niastella caeni TaxID=2569763 RepID=A0A4S8H7G8_9BACT|nr:response regulator transcription factor [Niastella caeni]THU30788.1 response regulator transcription factor [Niastella caeni]